MGTSWPARAGRTSRPRASVSLLGVGTNQAAILLERRRSEESMRESEERFRGTFENAAVGIAHKDVEGRFLRVNQKYCEIVGYTRAGVAR